MLTESASSSRLDIQVKRLYVTFDLWFGGEKREEIFDDFILASRFLVGSIGEVDGEVEALEDPSLSAGVPASGDEGTRLEGLRDAL